MDITKPITVAVLGSHSALDVCRGAKDIGFKTLVIAQKGRDKTYSHYYKTHQNLGCVDECLVLEKFSDMLTDQFQQELLERNCIFIPHRSFQVYLNFDYSAIEKQFKVPVFGNKYLLKTEERSARPNQYDLLKKANIKIPKQFKNPQDIDRLCIVKVLEKKRGFERAFFLVESHSDYLRQVEQKLNKGVFTKQQLNSQIIEEFIAGVQVNLNYFYSPISKRLELLGTDTRRQTNLEGINKLPASSQIEILRKTGVKYEEAGHMAVTILESMLDQAFEIGEKFVKVCQADASPGVIGPFGLQAAIIPGPPKKDFVIFDVSPRMPGSPGLFATPYSGYLYGESMSVGKRVASEIKQALKDDKLNQILT